MEKDAVQDGVRVVRIKAWNITEDWNAPFPLFSPTLAFTLSKYIRDADIVHVHDSFYISSFFASVISWIYRKPLLLTQHVAMIAHPSKIIVAIQKIVYATTGKIIFSLSKRIFVFNNRIENFLLEKGVLQDKIISLFNGVDTEVFRPAAGDEKKNLRKKFNLSLEKKIVLFVGRFVPKKGFDKVLRLGSSEYQVACVGGEESKEKIEGDVVFLGKVDQSKLAEIYRAADIFLLPSESEGFPLSVQEAMASGLPIITTDDPGYEKYHFDRQNMHLIDNTDIESIRKIVLQTCRDEKILQRMSTYSERYAKENFNWDKSIAKLDGIYSELIGTNSGKKHITVVSPYFYPKIGGLENIAYTTARNLHQSGIYRVSIITSNHTGKEYVKETIDGMIVHRLPIQFILSNSPVNLTWYWKIKRIFKADRPDLIHVHSPVPYIADMAAYAAGKTPVVITYHSGSMRKNKWPVDILIDLYEKVFLVALFKKVVAIVAYSPEFIEKELRPFKEKTFYISPGVDLNRFTPTPLSQNKVVTFVGRMEHATKWKGVETLLKAVSIYAKKDPTVRLRLVGTGDAIEHYKKMAFDLNIGSNVVCTGPKLGGALTEEYQRADVVVLPSTSNAESFGMVLVEAMASGRPIIGSNIGGIPQLIDDGKNGLLVAPGDEAALEQAIEKVLTDKKLASTFAERSLVKAREFNWAIQVEKYQNLFKEILKVKSKKVALVTDALYPYNKGGKEKRIYDISTRLAARGYDVTVYSMKWWNGPKKITENGVKLYGISPYFPLYEGKRRSIKEGVLFSLHALKLLWEDFDIIEVDHIPHLVLFTVKIVCVIKRKKMIATWHEVWGKTYWKKYLGAAGLIGYWIEKVSSKLPDIIISVSEHTTGALKKTLSREKNVVTISNGLDVIGTRTGLTKSNGADIIFAGRLLAHKNIDILLHAIAILKAKNIDVTANIIGEGPERTNLENLALQLDLTDRVTFKDFFMDHKELYSMMQASRVFVLPSTREGFSIVALEANACGLPVVAIDHPENAAKNLITDGGNGILTTLDESALAESILKAFKMKENEQNYDSYIKEYDWDSLISKVITVYE
ncbi:MAG: hypothetical protein JWO00_273 [Candidatus Parcubacteria bacterium]|nr:hypothetical protein [Candidatus Parcubacteria bacterium]